MASPSFLARFKNVVAGIEEVLAVTFLAAVTVLLITQFVTRYFLSIPLMWTEELSRYSFVWMIFIGSALLAARNAHIVVTFISDIVPPRVSRLMVRVASSIMLVAAAVTSWTGLQFVQQTSALASPATGIPMSYIYFAPVLGFGLIALHSIQFVVSGSGTPEGPEIEAAI